MTEPLPPTVGAETTTAAAAEWPVVPGYEVLAELGRGGMGVVYRARQLSLQREVALKVIRDGALAGAPQRARFRVEAEASARMSHPNIVAVYDVGEHAGRPYFAMELIDGPSLEKHVAGRPQPPTAAAELVRTLAGAVQHAHDQNIVHRDLKPANILLAAGRGLSAFPKITDFGLAKRLDSLSTVLTQEGAVIGTASYMAPEQAAGRSSEIGPAIDVWALGAILYELLTGRPPFLAETWQQIIEQVLRDEPTPPARLCSSVPAHLETICLKCLEKDPARRYWSAAALAEDLGKFRDGAPIAAVPLSSAERLARAAARDGYELLDELGRGPHSTVYRARHASIPQPVAVKVFAISSTARDEWDSQVRQHIEARAGLSHPNIVSVLRSGWWDDTAFVAMELVPHGSLAARLVGRPFPIREALRLAEQLTEVVGYAHRQGVVHGNLKPSNVLFAADGIPRVSDFRPTGGLFRGPLDVDKANSTGLGFVAPEILHDPSIELRPNADIYGLGLILYELLTGRPAFAAETGAETAEHVLTQEPIAPSQLNPKLTGPLESCCLRCLRKNPWHRYGRAFDLQKRLQHLQND
jgi:serine/threonine protein kinase